MRQPFTSLVVYNITEEKEEYKYLNSGERPENIGFLEQKIYNDNATKGYYVSKINKLNGFNQFFNEPLDNWKITYKSNIRNIFRNEAFQEYIELEHSSLSVKLHIKLKYFCEHFNNLIIENGIIKNKIVFLYDKEELFIAPEGTLEYVTALKFLSGATETRIPRPGDIVSSKTYEYSKMIYLGKAYKTDCCYLTWFSLNNYFKDRVSFDRSLNRQIESADLFSTTTNSKHIFACLKGNKVELVYVSSLKKMSILDSIDLSNFKFEDITFDLDKEEIFIPVLNWKTKIYTYAPFSYLSNTAFHTANKPSKKQIEDLLKNRNKFYQDEKFNHFIVKHDRFLRGYSTVQINELKTYINNFFNLNIIVPKDRKFTQLRGTAGQLITEG